jgi:DNA processing protein
MYTDSMSAISKLRLGEKGYPERLAAIHAPPKQLYVAGQLPAVEHWVAVVGSRKATTYGRDVAHSISAGLARRGVVIVSGFALGIDSAAHQAALEAGGQTVAVMGGGLNQLYPSSNRQLAEQIVKRGGALISEYEPDAPLLRQQFPARNRIIAGLCQLTVVVEAALSSGSLITATMALEENREVMAVPGNINQPASAGCNNLIKQGALPLTGLDDALSLLGLAQEDQSKGVPDEPLERQIYQLIVSGIHDTELLAERSGADMPVLSRALTSLELSGFIRPAGGGQWTAH